MEYDLSRFVHMHKENYETALAEIKSGKKQSHWMWYIFPQIRGLGKSHISRYFAIESKEEAKAFLQDDYLGNNLVRICDELIKLPENDPYEIFGHPDDIKLKSSMTLFSMISEEDSVFHKALDKFFDGKQDGRTIGILEGDNHHGEHSRKNKEECNYNCDDDNIDELRERYPNGLSFVVGDVHGQCSTLIALMDKIKFDPSKDKVYFVGDYNSGGDVRAVLAYLSLYYEENYDLPGFHLIRGNHERELWPIYPLLNLPDIIVLKYEMMTYYIVHAGMTGDGFNIIHSDIKTNTSGHSFAYRLDESITTKGSVFHQITYSKNGLYSQKPHYGSWVSEDILKREKVCVIHGHAPYCFFVHDDYYSYGKNMLFWEKQHVFFSENLQSFNIDSDIKGRCRNDQTFRGLSCVCLEVIEEIAANNGILSCDGIRTAPNFVFTEKLNYNYTDYSTKSMDKVINASPKMKSIFLMGDGRVGIN